MRSRLLALSVRVRRRLSHNRSGLGRASFLLRPDLPLPSRGAGPRSPFGKTSREHPWVFLIRTSRSSFAPSSPPRGLMADITGEGGAPSLGDQIKVEYVVDR